jgi:hypothetical protein
MTPNQPRRLRSRNAETKGVIFEGARGRDLQTRRAVVPLHSQHRIH